MTPLESTRKVIALDKARIETKISTLENDVVVATARDDTARSVSCAICVRHGSAYEGLSGNGVSHAIEHWTLNGSKRYSFHDLARRLARIGGDLDHDLTATTHDRVSYGLKSRTFTKMRDELLPRLTDMILRPCDAEAPYLLEALRSIQTESAAVSHDYVSECAENAARNALFPSHPVGQPVDGTPESIASLTPAILKKMHARYYSPGGRFIIAAAGRVRHDEFKKLATELLGRLPQKRINDHIPKPPIRPIGRIEVPLPRPSNKGSFLLLGWNVTPVLENPKDLCALDLILSILGSSCASRLYRSLRMHAYIGYGPGAFLEVSRFHAAVFVETECFQRELKDAERICMEEITRIRTKSVSAGEFSDFALRERQIIREKADDTDKLLDELVDKVIHRRPKALFEAYRLLDPKRNLITRKDLLRVAQTYLDPANYVVVRVEGTKPFEAA
ncbi:MAG: pitrilysin family protein [bacterium]|nr:pitrilysin family protein [bacterium]